MALNEISVGAPPEAVFGVLSDPRTYSHWVFGSREVRAADPDWPAPGAALDHTIGTGPLRIKDHTEVESVSPPVRIQLIARARPFPDARVTLDLEPEGDGTRVRMTEAPASGLLSLLAGPVGHGLIYARNAESLKRLKRLAEGAEPRPRGWLPQRGEVA